MNMKAEGYAKVLAAVIVSALFIGLGFVGYAIISHSDDSDMSLMKTFNSKHDLDLFFKDASRIGGSGNDTRYDLSYGQEGALTPATGDAPEHSETNVQVVGVDEDDTVKTDGAFIYKTSWDRVTIIKAYPPSSLANVSVIDRTYFTDKDPMNVSFYVQGIFIAPGKLVVVWNSYENHYWLYRTDLEIGVMDSEDFGPRTMVSVFDVSDPSEPDLEFSVGVSGWGVTSRMVDGVVYAVVQYYSWSWNDRGVSMPRVWRGDASHELTLDKIHYDPETLDAFSFLNILAVEINTGDFNYESVVGGYSSTTYMSTDALYLTYQRWSGDFIRLEVSSSNDDEWTTWTTIFKISVDGLAMETVAKGEVKGWLLNQFSMDEKDSYLRLATTNGWWTDSKNNVYVLDSQLNTVGSLEGLAPSERIYSARFVGDALYLVTFRQVDPLFVIDLSDPSSPEVVGELQMPGFSYYLHPVDESHVLGIGAENGSLKVSLYDVSDPANPMEMNKFVDSGYSWSSTSWDHKAVLFDRERELLVIPVWGWQYDDSLGYSNYKSGAYVFKVSLQDGVSLRGVITHEIESDYWYSEIERSLFIGDYLYTLSWTKVQVNSLDDLSYVNSLVYYKYEYSWWVY